MWVWKDNDENEVGGEMKKNVFEKRKDKIAEDLTFWVILLPYKIVKWIVIGMLLKIGWGVL